MKKISLILMLIIPLSVLTAEIDSIERVAEQIQSKSSNNLEAIYWGVIINNIFTGPSGLMIVTDSVNNQIKKYSLKYNYLSWKLSLDKVKYKKFIELLKINFPNTNNSMYSSRYLSIAIEEKNHKSTDYYIDLNKDFHKIENIIRQVFTNKSTLSSLFNMLKKIDNISETLQMSEDIVITASYDIEEAHKSIQIDMSANNYHLFINKSSRHNILLSAGKYFVCDSIINFQDSLYKFNFSAIIRDSGIILKNGIKYLQNLNFIPFKLYYGFFSSDKLFSQKTGETRLVNSIIENNTKPKLKSLNSSEFVYSILDTMYNENKIIEDKFRLTFNNDTYQYYLNHSLISEGTYKITNQNILLKDDVLKNDFQLKIIDRDTLLAIFLPPNYRTSQKFYIRKE